MVCRKEKGNHKMKVKVELYIDIDKTKEEKYDNYRKRLEEIVQKYKGKKKEALWTGAIRYHVFIYHEDPVFYELLRIQEERTREYAERYEESLHNYNGKSYMDLYEENNERLEKMLAEKVPKEEIMERLMLYWEEMQNVLRKSQDEKYEEELRNRPKHHIYVLQFLTEYTEEERKEIVGYIVHSKVYCEEIENKGRFLRKCESCGEYSEQIASCILKKSQTMKKWATKRRIYNFQAGHIVNIPMYEFLVEKGVAEEYFRPVYTGIKQKELVGYQIVAKNKLPIGSYTKQIIKTGEKCSVCGNWKHANVVEDVDDIYYQCYHERYLDMEKTGTLQGINLAYGELEREYHTYIFTPEMTRLLKEGDPRIEYAEVFPLSYKEKLGY